MSDYMIGCKVYEVHGQKIEFYYDDNKIGKVTVEAMDAIIDRLINSVEVVRCKDCKQYLPWLDDKICMRLGSYYGNTKPTDFCSHGECRADTRGES